LTKGREDTILDVLDPEIFVDTEVFQSTIEGDEESGAENGVVEVEERVFVQFNVGDKGIEEKDVGNG